MITTETNFPNLEPNHSLHDRTNADGDRVIVVVCPFTDESGAHFETPWDADENEPDGIDCLFCETLNRVAGKTDHGFVDHGCYDSGDREIDDP